MQKRALGASRIHPIGFGCMNVSHAYSTPPGPEAARALLALALDLGVTHFDTAALYGFGANEELVGGFLKPHRDKVYLASKCGMTGVDGKRVIDGRPETLRRTIEDSLRRLQTDVIDLYYLHRWDKAIPIEDSVGELGRMVQSGKVRAIGLSEVSAATLRTAHGVHPIAAVQSEYSLWTRNPEIGVLRACAEIGAAFVAFSPLARGWLTGEDISFQALEPRDIRRFMPRFEPAHMRANAPLLTRFRAMAGEAGCTPAQLALAWVLAQGDHVHAIPGTTAPAHLRDNMGADRIELAPDLLRRLSDLFTPEAISGPRYGAAIQAEIDTEDF